MMAASVASVVFFGSMSQLAADRTRIIQRDIGLNLRIIPEETDLQSYWVKGYADGVIDESLLGKIQQQDVANRLVPMLQRAIPWGSSEAILTGLGEEIFARGETLKPVFGGFGDQENEITVGAVAATKRGISEGDLVKVLGQDFLVKRVLSSSGSVDDVRVFVRLDVSQRLLELPGKINEIRALECECGEEIADPEAYVRSILQPLVPGAQIIRQDQIADARRKQRLMAERLGTIAIPVLILLSALCVAGLSFVNGYQRKAEIGLLNSVGFSAREIASLILCRWAFLGVIAGIFGSLVGLLLVYRFGEAWVGKGSWSIGAPETIIALSAIAGGVVAACGSIIPAVFAAKSDAATMLRGD